MKIFTFIIFNFIFFISHAGIRTGGNGGGFGEMKAVLVWEEMPAHLRLCLTSVNRCQLSSQEQLLIVKVVQALPREKQIGGIVFFDDPTLRKKIETQAQIGAKIYINSSLLTSKNGVVQKSSQIATWILWALLRHHANEDAQQSLYNLSFKIFGNFSEQIQTSKYLISSSTILLHKIKSSLGTANSYPQERLVLEDKLYSYDLFSVVDFQNYCQPHQNPIFKLTSLNAQNSGLLIHVQIKWSCDAARWGDAILIYSLKFDSPKELLVWPPQVEVKGMIRP